MRPHLDLPIAPVVALVGPFGSGKSEIAVNLARRLAADGHRVTLADLDVVNPYFRSREARLLLEQCGVRVLAPPPEAGFADLPVMAPGVVALLGSGLPAVLDAAGDAPGARVLRTLARPLRATAHDVLFVVNACRPDGADARTALDALHAFEDLAGLEVTGVVANAHLLDETTAFVVAYGMEVARAVAEGAGVPLVFASVGAGLAPSLEGVLGVPVLPIERTLLPPDLRSAACA